MSATETQTSGGCPVDHGKPKGDAYAGWSDDQPRLVAQSTRSEDTPRARTVRPTRWDASFNYAEEFKKLDLAAVKRDLTALMTASQPWWPAGLRDTTGPFFIRMGVAQRRHVIARPDGPRGGAGFRKRNASRRSTAGPTTRTSIKRVRLLWPIKQKYGKQISWADLFVLAGNRPRSIRWGLKSFGFGGGRVDVWEPEEEINWGQ